MISTAVVTGGSGFIGQTLVAHLVNLGVKVTVIDRNPPVREDVTYVQGDLASDDLSELMRASAVFHLAGSAGVRGTSPDLAEQRRRDNVLATTNVMRWTPLDVPVVFTSSSSVYGGSRGAPCREDGPIGPLGGYALSKLQAEHVCTRRAERGGRIHVARLFTVLGERQRPDMALSIWSEAMSWGRPVRVLGGVDRTRDFTDVKDVAKVLHRLALEPSNLLVNVGTGRGQSLSALISALARAMDVVPKLEVLPAGPEEPAATLASTERLNRLLGYALNTDLDVLACRFLAARYGLSP